MIKNLKNVDHKSYLVDSASYFKKTVMDLVSSAEEGRSGVDGGINGWREDGKARELQEEIGKAGLLA